MEIAMGALGPWKYEAIYVPGLGSRVEWINAPPEGTKLLADWNDGKEMWVDGISSAGEVICTDCDGFQSASFPGDLKVPNAEDHARRSRRVDSLVGPDGGDDV